MKVLWFSNSPANATEYLMGVSIGGGWLNSLDKELQERVELHNAFYYPKRNDSFKYLRTTYHPIGERNWKLIALKELFWETFIDQQDLPKYLEIINSVKPDIIHINGTENPFGCIIGNTKVPVVTSIQGNITVYKHKYFSGIEEKYLKTFIPINNSIEKILFKPCFKKSYQFFIKIQKREERNLINSEYIIGRTDWDRRITSILAPNSKYFHIDEILRESFYKVRWIPSKPSEQIIIHTTNANCYYKGLETLCQALYELNKIGIKVDWRVAGVSANDLIVKIVRKKLKNKFPGHGLYFLGPLNEQQLLNKLLEADIYVLPSHIENSPNNLCEAMILGMPCIATFTGGTDTLLRNQEEGILIQDGDPWSMAGAILELHQNRTKAMRFGEAAHSRAVIRHNKEIIVKELLNTYENILNKNTVVV
jgi:glycosyltransferase involved in cell wall biosynthesis